MQDVFDTLAAGFSFLNQSEVLGGVSILTWLVIGVIFGMIGAYIRGKK